MKIRSSNNLPWGYARSFKKFGPNGSVVLNFIGYKRSDIKTNTNTSKVYIKFCYWKTKGERLGDFLLFSIFKQDQDLVIFVYLNFEKKCQNKINLD